MPRGGEKLKNARIIAQVGKSMGMSQRDILIGIMTALQESGLRNLNYGDRDSLGLFQQRPSAGWGTPSQVTDPHYASRKFFQRLSQIGGRNNMELWQAAQAVQISAYPRRYADHEGAARSILGKVGLNKYKGSPWSMWGDSVAKGEALEGTNLMNGLAVGMPGLGDQISNQMMTLGAVDDGVEGDPLESAMDKLLGGEDTVSPAPGVESPGSPGAEAPDQAMNTAYLEAAGLTLTGGKEIGRSLSQGSQASGVRGGVAQLAKRYVGRPYVWGATGPSSFDCSGFTQYVLGKMGVRIPRLAYQQARFGTQTSIRNLRPGDLVFWGNNQRTQGNHIALYLGDGRIIEAPRPGLSVRVRNLSKSEDAVGIRLKY